MSIRELRQPGAEIVDRVRGGEPVTISRGGQVVAELRPPGLPSLTREALLERWRFVPAADACAWRADVDHALGVPW